MSLKIKILSGAFLVNLDIFKQDPYVKFTYMGKTYKTKVLYNWGKKAKWANAVFELGPIHYNSKIQLEAWDWELATSHDCIGKTAIMYIRDFAGIKGPQTIKIYYKGKLTGTLVFEMSLFQGKTEVIVENFFRKELGRVNKEPEDQQRIHRSTIFDNDAELSYVSASCIGQSQVEAEFDPFQSTLFEETTNLLSNDDFGQMRKTYTVAPLKLQDLDRKTDKKENSFRKSGRHGHNNARKRNMKKTLSIKENVPKVADKVDDKPAVNHNIEKKLGNAIMAIMKKENQKGKLTKDLSADKQAKMILQIFKRQKTKFLEQWQKPENVGKQQFRLFQQLNQITGTLGDVEIDDDVFGKFVIDLQPKKIDNYIIPKMCPKAPHKHHTECGARSLNVFNSLRTFFLQESSKTLTYVDGIPVPPMLPFVLPQLFLGSQHVNARMTMMPKSNLTLNKNLEVPKAKLNMGYRHSIIGINVLPQAQDAKHAGDDAAKRIRDAQQFGMPMYCDSGNDSECSSCSSSCESDNDEDDFVSQYQSFSHLEERNTKPTKELVDGQVMNLMQRMKSKMQRLVNDEVPKISEMKKEDREAEMILLLQFALDKSPFEF